MSRDMQAEFTDTVYTHGFDAWWAAYDVPGVNVRGVDQLAVGDAVRRYLPWEPVKLPTWVLPDVGEPVATGGYAIVRDDTHAILSNGRSERYMLFPNADLADLLGDATQNLPHTTKSVGSIYGGRKVFASIALDDVPEVTVDGQTVYPYLAVVNTHDGTGALSCYATGIVPQCSNTINLGIMSGATMGQVIHTTNMAAQVDRIHANVASYYGIVSSFEAEMAALLDMECGTGRCSVVLDRLYPIPDDDGTTGTRQIITRRENTRDAVHATLHSDKVHAPDTGWGMWMALNTVDQWQRGFRRGQASTLAERNLGQAFGGNRVARDHQFLSTIRDVCLAN